MSVGISDKTLVARLNRQLSQARTGQADALGKLSSGTVFTPEDPRPSDRALSEKMEYHLRSLSSAKRNVNDAISLMQMAEGGMNEINNIMIRMKEINTSAASTVVSDQERRFLFVEYEALRDEVDRIAKTTEFNGIPLLNGDSEKTPEEMILRVGDPFYDDQDMDLNEIRLTNLKDVVTTAAGLGIISAAELLASSTVEDGISVTDAMDLMEPEDPALFATVYDEAAYRLTQQRSVYGAIQARMQRSMDYIDVYQENLTAAKAKISDTDYATEVAKLVDSRLRLSATTSLMSQANINASSTIGLLNSVLG